MFFFLIKTPNPPFCGIWGLGVGLKNPQRIFSDKVLTNIVKKFKIAAAAELQWHDVSSNSDCVSGLYAKENMSSMKESILVTLPTASQDYSSPLLKLFISFSMLSKMQNAALTHNQNEKKHHFTEIL